MKNINKKVIIYGIVILLFGVLLGWFIFKGNTGGENKKDDHQHNLTETEEGIWTCSMHPQIRQPGPGACPICGMDLIPLETGSGKTDPLAISMTPTAMQLAQVETMTIGGSGKSSKSIRLDGKIQADERLINTQSSHVPGRIEKLMVNFTGDFVKQGQVIAYVYSPELVVAQQELFEAQKIKDMQPGLFNSAKEKLRNWKLSDSQISRILSSGKPIEQFPVLSNTSGYVTQKMVNTGDYVKSGSPIYQVSDLSKVWVLLDVYESDIRWIKKGYPVAYTVSSLPGETFNGVVSYIDPVFDPVTRVANARIEVINKGYRLKPEMFVSGIVKSDVSTGSTSSIIIPKSAVMWTGKRSVVYVMQMTDQDVSYRLREVTLGQDLGDSFVIESGLESGEQIAVHGTFAIDAAAQLAGKPSMMSPENNKVKELVKMISKKASVSSEAKKALMPIFDAYYKLTDGLTKDNTVEAQKAGKILNTALMKVDMKLFKGEAHDTWMKQSETLKKSINKLNNQNNIQKLRDEYMHVSAPIIVLAESFGPFDSTIYVQNCPMANSNKGADWLSKEKKISNPYFGKNMLTCGETKRTLK